MPAIGFKYPEGDTISFEDALENKKLDIERMGVYPTALKEMSKQRDPGRKPAVTELIHGTCQANLQRTEEYHDTPQEDTVSMAGTHQTENVEKEAEDRERETATKG